VAKNRVTAGNGGVSASREDGSVQPSAGRCMPALGDPTCVRITQATRVHRRRLLITRCGAARALHAARASATSRAEVIILACARVTHFSDSERNSERTMSSIMALHLAMKSS
jgi:hypothetical protein